MDVVITEAQAIFGAAAVVVTIVLTILNGVWKALAESIASLPSDKRRVRFNLQGIEDIREKDKAEYISTLTMGIIFLGVTLFLSLISMLMVVSVTLGYNAGFSQKENYDFGKGCLYVSVFFRFASFWAFGWAYATRLIVLARRGFDLATTDLIRWPPLSESALVRRKRAERQALWLLIATTTAIFLLTLFNRFSAWGNALVAVAVVGLRHSDGLAQQESGQEKRTSGDAEAQKDDF